MRVFIDATGAPKKSGGMALWRTELLLAWIMEFPEDEITIAGDSDLKEEFRPLGIRTIRVAGPSRISRSIAQLLLVPFHFFRTQHRSILSLNSVISPLLWRAETTLINHDWRHLKNPGEFSSVEKLYRKSWGWATRFSDNVIAISPKTATETSFFWGRKVTQIVSPGGDHLSRATGPSSLGRDHRNTPFLVAFAQHNNKRPELVLDALARLANRENARTHGINLFVLGAFGATLGLLERHAAKLGLKENVRFFDFVDASTYADMIRNASAVLLVSTDEGFGVPAVEAKREGTPVIVSEESGVGSLHEHALVATNTAESLATCIEQVLDSNKTKSPAPVQSWSDTAKAVRLVVKARNDTPPRSNGGVTVITPSLNSLARLKETVDSVQKEACLNVERTIQHVIVDGASTDGTVEYFQDNSFSNVTFVSRPDKSLFDAVADGLVMATENTIIMLGAGDLLLPHASRKITNCVEGQGISWGSGEQHFHFPSSTLPSFARKAPFVSRTLAKIGAYGGFSPAIQQESTFFSRELIDSIDLEKLRSLTLAGDSFIWSCIATQTRHHRVKFPVGSFMLHEGQLSENRQAYKDELRKVFRPWRFDLVAISLLGLVNLEWLVRNLGNRRVRT